MGGKATAISDSTVDVLLEAAHFTPAGIAGRARRLGPCSPMPRSDSSARRRLPRCPRPPSSVRRALVLEIAGGEPGPTQVARAPDMSADAREWVSLRRARLAGILGVRVPDDEVAEVLSALEGDTVETTADGWRLARPPHRFDVRIEEDLVEEVARLRGFDRIDEAHATAPQIAGEATERRVSNDRLLTAMADRGVPRSDHLHVRGSQSAAAAVPEGAEHAALQPHLSADLAEMRVSLWPGLVQAVPGRDQRRQQARVAGCSRSARKFQGARRERRAGLAGGSKTLRRTCDR